MTFIRQIGALGFILWGLLHIVGGAAIMATAWGDPDAGFATYRTAAGPYDALAGDILAYFAFFLVLAGVAVAAIGIKGNWRADQSALAINTAGVLAVELGLVLFLLLPGHLSFAEASPGFILALIGIVAGGIACNANHEVAHADG